MRRPLALAAIAVTALLAGCAHDGRGLGSANSNSRSIIKATTTVDTSQDQFSDETLPGDEGTDVTDTVEEDGMAMTTPFAADDPIPAKYTCDGAGVAPAITWSKLPEGTVEVAIQVVDLEAEDFTHWVIAGLKPDAGGIAEGQIPAGAIQAKNTHGTLGYYGPCPPKGSTHNYLFEVDALDSHITLANGTDADTMLQAVGAATIQSASNSGTVTR